MTREIWISCVRYIVNAKEYDEDQVKYGHVRFVTGKAANSICTGQKTAMAYLLDMYVRTAILLPWKKDMTGNFTTKMNIRKEKEKENDIYENI